VVICNKEDVLQITAMHFATVRQYENGSEKGKATAITVAPKTKIPAMRLQAAPAHPCS